MTVRKQIRAKGTEIGVALLISIFILLLISVVAIALIVSSSTESSLAGNYRSATGVYFGATAGLEEARGRLSSKDPNSFKNTAPGFLPTPGTPLAIGSVAYVLNPGPTDAIGSMLSTTYQDKEYDTEFGAGALGGATVTTTTSVWNNNPLNTLSFPPPLYKWVRINAVTEKSLNLLVAPSFSPPYDATTPVYYDGVQLNISGSGSQVLEVTALASLPNGGQKIVQYLVAPMIVNLIFPAALTMDGYSDAFSSPDHSVFQIRGDADSSDAACSSMPYPVPAIGVPDSADVGSVTSGIPVTPHDETGNFTGTGGPPSVSNVRSLLTPNLQTVQGLNQLAQTIIQNADAVISDPSGNANQSNLPSAMSSTNPMTIAVQGDPTQPLQGNFFLGPGFTGYGLLLVTGNFTYATDSNWYGIVLVIGQGTVTAVESGPGGTFTGATLIAQTRNSSGAPLAGPHPGPASFNDTVGPNVGRGFLYNCSWIQAAQLQTPYKILSFHEIAQ